MQRRPPRSQRTGPPFPCGEKRRGIYAVGDFLMHRDGSCPASRFVFRRRNLSRSVSCCRRQIDVFEKIIGLLEKWTTQNSIKLAGQPAGQRSLLQRNSFLASGRSSLSVPNAHCCNHLLACPIALCVALVIYHLRFRLAISIYQMISRDTRAVGKKAPWSIHCAKTCPSKHQPPMSHPVSWQTKTHRPFIITWQS